jgi:hypothetical protein
MAVNVCWLVKRHGGRSQYSVKHNVKLKIYFNADEIIPTKIPTENGGWLLLRFVFSDCNSVLEFRVLPEPHCVASMKEEIMRLVAS